MVLYRLIKNKMPLTIPTQFKTYKVLSIDPGLNRTGIAIYTIDMELRKAISLEAFTLVNEKLIDEIEFEETYHSERVFKLYRLKNAFTQIIRDCNPSAVVCESPFYSSFRPTAYASLVEVISHLHDCVIQHNHNTLFRTVEPMVVKKTVGATLTNNKSSVKDAIMTIPDITTIAIVDINMLDEHAIDAIAIGYTFFKNSGENLICSVHYLP
jgi:Holliday junction resolvasome RuvABC endonuclease subunit